MLLLLFIMSMPVAHATPDMFTAIAQMGVLNRISTGFPALDMALCFLLPSMMNMFFPSLKEFMRLRLRPRRYKFYRQITFVRGDNSKFQEGPAAIPTALLQQAVLAAMNKNPELSAHLDRAEIQLGLAPRNVTERGPQAMEPRPALCPGGRPKGALKHRPPPVNRVSDPLFDPLGLDLYDPLQSSVVNVVPMAGSWVTIMKGVEFMKEEFNGGKEESGVVTFRFRSNEPNGNVLIDNLVKEAFQKYQQEQADVVDNTRYLYMPIHRYAPRAQDAGGLDSYPKKMPQLYKRYALSNERTFSSFFHPEKEAVLQLVDDFQAQTGKFATPGYPQKLGFLLHGPPGTGKTSFIKALAQYTNRHVISIPLSLIETNQELMDIMFDQKYNVVNGNPATGGRDMHMSFERTIFVFEDVDAAGDVVLSRTPAATQPPVMTTQPPVMTAQPTVMTAQPPVMTTQPPVMTTQPPVMTNNTATAFHHDHLPQESNPAPAGNNSPTNIVGHQSFLSGEAASLLGTHTHLPATNAHVPANTASLPATNAAGPSINAIVADNDGTYPANIVNTHNTGNRARRGKSGPAYRPHMGNPFTHVRPDGSMFMNVHAPTSSASDASITKALKRALEEDTGFSPTPHQAADMLALMQKQKKKKTEKPIDKLNLAGLLNALDGVVDTPGRIVIMTSNHPGKLDSALIRPGRINKCVYMGRLVLNQALQMVQHYFKRMEPASVDEWKRCWVDECWSPAELEALCGECQTVDELLQQLRAKTGRC